MESRNRIVFHLPLNNSGQEKAVFDIVGHIRRRRSEKTGIGGYTFSKGAPTPVFNGAWWSKPKDIKAEDDKNKGAWVDDKIVLFMLDVLDPTPKARFSVMGVARDLKTFVAQAYGKRAGKEEDIWIILHSVNRVV